MPQIKKRNASSDKVSMKFDVPMLNALIKYMQCDFVSQAQMSQLSTLIHKISLDDYNYSPDIQNRLRLIGLYTDAVVNNNMRDSDIIQTFITGKDSDMAEVMSTQIEMKRNQLISSECKAIAEVVNERMQTLYVYQVKDEIITLFDKLNDTQLVSYYEVLQQLKAKIGELNVKLQGSGSQNGLIQQFSFSDPSFPQLMDAIVTKAKRPSAILQTGMRQWNAILSPGFHSTRLYVILGGTGKFKSGTLLNLADQIRKFNPQINPFENGLRKTILFLTLENTVEESVMRLFDMYADEEDLITNMTTEQVIAILKEKGGYNFTNSAGIDIDMVYRANLSITTADIYSMIQDLENKGKSVMCLIVDYLLRLESVANSYGDERLRVSYATKELKSLAQFFEIPVISAMQINRDGNAIIDAAMRDKKQDVAQFVGTSSVGIAWDVIQESDWVGLVNLEMQLSTMKLFLTTKRLKIRYKKDPFSVDYFNHPFVNNKNIRLATDVDQDKPLSIMSLASDLETVDEKELDKVKNSRPKMSKMAHDDRGNSILKSIQLPCVNI